MCINLGKLKCRGFLYNFKSVFNHIEYMIVMYNNNFYNSTILYFNAQTQNDVSSLMLPRDP